MSDLHITTQLLAAPAEGAPQSGPAADAAAGFDFPALFARQLGAAPQAQDDAAPRAPAEAGRDETGETVDAFGLPLATATAGAATHGAEDREDADAPQPVATVVVELPPALLPPLAALATLATAKAANDSPPASALPAAAAGALRAALAPCAQPQAATAQPASPSAGDAAPEASADAPRSGNPPAAPGQPESAAPQAQADIAATRVDDAPRAAVEVAARASREPEGTPLVADPGPAARPGAFEGRPAALAVPGQVHTPLWREELVATVRVIAVQRIQHAELHVHPPELGPVQVSLRLEGSEATVSFAAPHAETRAALEAALPRLREMLEGAGLSFGGASVDVSNPGQGQARDATPRARPVAYFPPAPPAAAPAAALGLVDVFA
jgi:flagellar hook-length control protein FliK